MKIVMNADDFGVDIDRDIGILWGVLTKRITSVSVIVTNKIGTLRKIMIKVMKKKADIGIHINLTDNPLIHYSIEELCNNTICKYEKSKFQFWENSIKNELNLNKIKEEIYIQIDMFKKKYKFNPQHIDGHNHCNIFNAEVEKIFEKISKNREIFLRIPYEQYNNEELKEILKQKDYNELIKIQREIKLENDYVIKNFNKLCDYDMLLNNINCIRNCKERLSKVTFIGTLYGYSKDYNYFIKKIEKVGKNAIVTTMFHPGFYFKFIKHKTKFSNKDRIEELKNLKKIKKYCKINKIELIKYGEIGNE